MLNFPIDTVHTKTFGRSSFTKTSLSPSFILFVFNNSLQKGGLFEMKKKKKKKKKPFSFHLFYFSEEGPGTHHFD